MRHLLYCAITLMIAARPSFADRVAYSGARDIVEHSATVTVRHHHDWSRTFSEDGRWLLRYSVATPFGVDDETSSLEFYSPQGAIVARVPSPPLTHLEISADGRYVIGLSKIKHLNATQLVVLNSTGELLLRRGISARVYCFSAKGYEELKRKHREAFDELARHSRVSYETYGWRESDKVYLDIRVGMTNPHWTALWHDLVPAMCDSPLSPNFGESVTNWIHWYHDTDPRPEVVERNGRPFEVRLRDPKGIEFAVRFERAPLEAQIAGRAAQ